MFHPSQISSLKSKKKHTKLQNYSQMSDKKDSKYFWNLKAHKSTTYLPVALHKQHWTKMNMNLFQIFKLNN